VIFDDFASSTVICTKTNTASEMETASSGDLISISLSRLQDLEARASRGELDVRNVELLREQVIKLEQALAHERARSEMQAAAFADLSRSCEDRAREHGSQHKELISKLEASCNAGLAAKDATIAEQRSSLAALEKQVSKLESRCDAIIAAKAAHVTLLKKQIVKLDASHAQTVAAKDAAAVELRTALGNLEREHAALRADTAARLSDLHASQWATVFAKDADIARSEYKYAKLETEVAAQLSVVHAAVTSKLALELHPVRRDRRQFATLHVGPVPFDEFDTAWCAAACGDVWT
jgi:polyhydroxyalkanoate synthesis regulator phasin